MSAFARATAVESLGDGAWRATCDGAWATRLGANGGYLAALIQRAMVSELDDPAREARSLTCHYLRPPAVGEVRLDVSVQRSGRSLSTVTARLSQAGALCVLAVAAFGIELNGAVDYAAQAPPAPRPERVDRLAPVAEVPITRHFVMRPTIGAPLYAGAEDSVTGGWLRFADPQALDAPALAMYADAWWPSPLPRLTRPVAAPTVDLTVHFRAPAVAAAIDEEPVLAVFRSSTAAGGFFEEDGQLWSRDGVLLAHSRQLALLVDGGR
ncbi:MAG: acyl-CoA thioesterase [Solirubrobacteraceae bacterium]